MIKMSFAMIRFNLILFLLLSLNSFAQTDTLSVYLGGTWNHNTANFNDPISVNVVFQNTGDSVFNATDVYTVTTITNSGGAGDTVDIDTVFPGVLFLSSPGDSVSATLDWIVDNTKYMPGNNVTVIWPASGTSTVVVEDSLKLNTFVDTTNNILEVSILDLNVYPNPSSDLIRIDHDKPLKSISIIAMNGAQVASPKPDFLVDISELARGMYIISIEDVNGRRSKGVFVKK